MTDTSVDTVTLEPWLPGVQGREVFEHIRRASAMGLCSGL